MSGGAEEFTAVLSSHFGRIRELSPAQLSRLFEHWTLLSRWNKALNLTTITGLETAVIRHYCESLFLGAYLPEQPVSVLDVGSGAGFPGIPAALLRPDCRFTLAESHQRKAVFLREATRDLPNVSVVPKRAEALDLNSFDWVVSRAVRWNDVTVFARKSLALLVGEEDATAMMARLGFSWQPKISLPWGDRRVLVMGTRISPI